VLASDSEIASLLVTGLWGLATGLMVAGGPIVGTVALSATVALVVFAGNATGSHAEIELAGFTLAGGSLQAGLATLVPTRSGYPVHPYLLRELREGIAAALTWASPIGRHAVRLGLALSAATAIYRVLPVDRGYWIPLTVLFVMRPEAGRTRTRILQRFLGTVLGLLAITLVVSVLEPGDLALALICAACMVPAYAYLWIDYTRFTTGIAGAGWHWPRCWACPSPWRRSTASSTRSSAWRSSSASSPCCRRRLGRPRDTEYARGHRREARGRGKLETPARLDGVAGPLDRGEGVAVRVAAAHQARPHERHRVLKPGADPVATPYVLVEAKLTARSQHTAQIRERRALVGHRAQHSGYDRRVEGCVLRRKCACDAVQDPDRHRRRPRRLHRALPQVRLGLHRHQLLDLPRIVREVEAVSRAHLDHAARQARQQLPSHLGLPAFLVLGREAIEEAREERMANGLLGTHRSDYRAYTAAPWPTYRLSFARDPQPGASIPWRTPSPWVASMRPTSCSRTGGSPAAMPPSSSTTGTPSSRT
jgi:hypothetical protein